MSDELSMPDGYDPNTANEEPELSMPDAFKAFLRETDAIARSDKPESPHILEFKDFLPRTNQEPEM